MLSENLVYLRKKMNLTQEDVAEKAGVSRQAVAKWESGETVPDIEKCRLLAELFDVTIDSLVNYEPSGSDDLGLPPKGKHMFGVVTVGDKGQVVIPAKARKLFDIKSGDRLFVLAEEGEGLALIKEERFLALAEMVKSAAGKK